MKYEQKQKKTVPKNTDMEQSRIRNNMSSTTILLKQAKINLSGISQVSFDLADNFLKLNEEFSKMYKSDTRCKFIFHIVFN